MPRLNGKAAVVTGGALVVDGGITLSPGGLFDRSGSPEERRERFMKMVMGQA